MLDHSFTSPQKESLVNSNLVISASEETAAKPCHELWWNPNSIFYTLYGNQLSHLYTRRNQLPVVRDQVMFVSIMHLSIAIQQ